MFCHPLSRSIDNEKLQLHVLETFIQTPKP